jgi:puromycin-sensitive aminopeptidase
MRRLILLVLVLAGGPWHAAHATRLPRGVVPVHYALHLTPDLMRGRFAGRASIELDVRDSTDRIVLHALGLHLTRAVLKVGTRASIPRIVPATATETVALVFEAPLTPGRAVLELAWEAALDRELRGLYLAGPAGQRYVATQLQSTDARRVFPSFDEPDLKARFTLSATVPRGLMAISNTPVEHEREDPNGQTRTLRFATTPPLPTYLLALLVGDFECLTDSHGSVPLRVCALRGRVAQGAYALEATKRALAFFEGYYGMPMPFAKLDQVALPDFAWSAMENPGAIVYVEDALLVDPQQSSPQARQFVDTVLGHELAHLWFGDYVTMRWWDDVWLNEGFATWLENRPWQADPDAIDLTTTELDSVALAFQSDVLRNARPMRNPVTTPDEILASFDDMAYQKAAAVLRMIEGWTGPDAFRAGVQAYLAAHPWGNTTAADFAEALSRSTERPVTRVLESYVRQPGLPVVELKARCIDQRTEVQLTQRRFQVDGGGGRETWSVPVCLRTSQGEHCELLEQRSQKVLLDGCAERVVGNSGGRGYYLVDHAPAQREALAAGFVALSTAERNSLLRDEWWLVRAGRRPIQQYLALSGRTLDDSGLGEHIERLSEAERTLIGPAERAGFALAVRSVLEPALARLPTGPEQPAETRAWRAHVLAALGRLADDAASQTEAREFAAAWRADPASVDQARSRPLLRLAVHAGDAPTHAALVTSLGSSTDGARRYDYLDALAMARTPELVTANLALVHGAELRPQEVSHHLAGLLRNPVAAAPTWALIRRDWERIAARVPAGHSALIVAAAGALCDRAHAVELESFLAAHPGAATAQEGARAADAIRACAAMRAVQRKGLTDYLQGLVAGQSAGG